MTAFTVGLGCDRGVLLETVREAVQAALAAAGATREQVTAAATITLKKDEAALLALAEEYGWPLHFYEAEQLAVVPVPHPSETVRRYTGTPSVSEAAALLAAGPDTPMSALLVEKHKLRGVDGRNATVSIARKNP
ncbi:cobalamin biosynthesis protein [Massilia sp. erpn]|uniref:cobalamin biosynthesis protein n=1 Tax=Massilia sp. erpn TaxID=2738142 RepID=UPI0021047F87|nr:cobalamin biosynthesis protein [Massilia sp. erpn]UTY58925.1 cobalamin biosynthesis protein [Massilia sp. erpn]